MKMTTKTDFNLKKSRITRKAPYKRHFSSHFNNETLNTVEWIYVAHYAILKNRQNELDGKLKHEPSFCINGWA